MSQSQSKTWLLSRALEATMTPTGPHFQAVQGIVHASTSLRVIHVTCTVMDTPHILIFQSA